MDVGRGNDGTSRRPRVKIVQRKPWRGSNRIDSLRKERKKEGPANEAFPDDITVQCDGSSELEQAILGEIVKTDGGETTAWNREEKKWRTFIFVFTATQFQ